MKLSIVVSARNDDYGGNFLHRFQASVNALAALAARHSLDAELIVVEWNPPAAAPRLKQALAWPAFPTRILTVPNEIHWRIEGSDRMPIFEFVAKNAGIRRSTSDFVLATNADIIFSDELVELLTRKLDDRAFYRAHRHDVRGLLPVEAPIDEQLAFCRAHVFQATEFKGGKYRFSSPKNCRRRDWHLPGPQLQEGLHRWLWRFSTHGALAMGGDARLSRVSEPRNDRFLWR